MVSVDYILKTYALGIEMKINLVDFYFILFILVLF